MVLGFLECFEEKCQGCGKWTLTVHYFLLVLGFPFGNKSLMFRLCQLLCPIYCNFFDSAGRYVLKVHWDT